MRTERWHEELERFLDIKTTFVLEGNVLDLHAYPTRTPDNSVRWDMVMLDNYLYRCFVDHGYQRIVFYNHIDGFYNEYDPSSVDTFAGKYHLPHRDQQTGTYKVPLCRAGEIIRQVATDKTELTAIIMIFASRYVLSSDNLSEQERDFYSNLLSASLKKTQISTSDGIKNNTLCLVCDKANDVPAWIYLENPFVKTLTIQEPDTSARRMFIDSQISFFPVGDHTPEELEKYKQHFVELTDGFKNLELNALKQLCRKEGLQIERIKDAINMYKYGLKDNPWNDIPRDRIENAEEFIRSRVKGQNHAVTQALDVVKRAAADMAGVLHSSGTKPKGILFFAGPTGTGKTELAKTLSELLFGDENACVRFDMSEYQQSHSDQKLLGAPPGYVGYESGGQLTNAVKEKPFSILLFDEIEKAHPSIFDKFLQILDDGRMTDGKGETVYFSECIIIFTSNLGIYKTDEYGRRVLNVDYNMPFEEMERNLITEIKNFFKLQLGRPEILNRIGDNFVVFDFIRKDVARQIMDAQLEKITRNLMSNKQIRLEISEDAVQALIDAAFGNLENGGRGIGNMVEKMMINPLSRFIFDNGISNGSTINIRSISSDNGVVSLDCEVA